MSASEYQAQINAASLFNAFDKDKNEYPNSPDLIADLGRYLVNREGEVMNVTQFKTYAEAKIKNGEKLLIVRKI